MGDRSGWVERGADTPVERAGPGWLGAWLAILAISLWLSRLGIGWLFLAAIGAAVWTVSLRWRRQPFGVSSAVLLWLAVGVAAGVQYRLAEIATDWEAVHVRIEDSAADALGESLDELVDRGERAVDGAAAAAGQYRDQRPTEALFAQLADLQRRSRVSAVAIYDATGFPIAWAGEHRGSVPEEVRLGTESYFFHEGPLFSYLYFVRPLPEGATAAAAFLLEANLGAGEGIVPFASRFERRHGTRPRFWHPDRARAEAIWDWVAERPILSVSFAALTQQQWWERVVGNGRRATGLTALAALLVLTVGWYGGRNGAPGVPVLVATVSLLLAPLGRFAGSDVLFSPLQFVLPGPLDVTLGALIVLLTGAAVWMLIRLEKPPPGRLPAWLALTAAAVIFPAVLFLIERSAAEGLLASRIAGGFPLQLATTLAISVPLFLVLRYAGAGVAVGRGRGAARVVGIALPALFGFALLSGWRPDQPAPLALSAVWVIPLALLLRARVGGSPGTANLRIWLTAGWLAGTVALAFLWPLHVAAELERSERELSGLGTRPDPFLDFLLRQFAEQAAYQAREGEEGVNLLYRSWLASGLAREGYEARMALWEGGEVVAELNLSARGPASATLVDAFEDDETAITVRHLAGGDGLNYLLIAPLNEERRLSVAVPPRRTLSGATPLARLLHPEQAGERGARRESLHLVPVDPESSVADHAGLVDGVESFHWARTSEGWRSEALVEMPEGPMHAHLVVADPGVPLLLTRAILVQAALLAVLAFLWLLARAICRDLGSVPLLRGRWFRSFRGRLSLALFGFFLLPTLVFGAVSYGAVAREVVRSAAALAQQALEQAAIGLQSAPLAEVGAVLPTDLLLYSRGALVGSTPHEVLELGLFHSWLSPEVFLRFAGGEDLHGLEERRLGQSDYLTAYRRLDGIDVAAAPIPLASQEISRRQQEFRDIALLMILLGLGLSVVLALVVSRALSRPLDQLSRAAATVGSGDFETRLPDEGPDEFGSVYDSFNQMVRRLRQTRAALVQETRRTETIVAEAATGVLALDGEGRVELVNPRAAEILGGSFPKGSYLLGGGGENAPLEAAIGQLWRAPSVESATEVEIDGRLVRLRLRRLRGEGEGGGAVVALEDITAEVRTARVLAWGEIARQVAHEIKNPLTPIKLSVQHLRRAYLDQRPDFGEILDRNVESILREIDRLGDIARAFSRFGSPAAASAPLEVVDVERVLRETVALYRGSGGDDGFHFQPPDRSLPPVVARGDELKEVLLNLLENAREAVSGGGVVRVSAAPRDGAEPGVLLVVEDTGIGIPDDQIPRIFEPHFSTRSSGTGLGLAIVRRIIDSWGAEIRVDSTQGEGTRFEIRLRAA